MSLTLEEPNPNPNPNPYPNSHPNPDQARFYKKSSDQHMKNACDVAYYNVLGWLTEIETGEP